jgi:hypothetical protein
MVSKKRFIITTLIGWLLFLMLDFLANASLLRDFWDREYPALKSKEELFRLIPFGYISFLILTLLVGWVYARFYPEKGSVKKGLCFGSIFGGLLALSLFLGTYSGFNLPVVFILLMSVVYYIEIVAISFCYGYLMYPVVSIKRRVWVLFGIIVAGFVLGIIVQNL